jgi:UTP--glucose-1-phosphate uridylyltransferase
LNLIKKCLFPVAGYGTRFLPATKTVPKEMLPILTKPLMHYGVSEAMNANMKSIAIVTSGKKKAIEDYFDRAYELEQNIKDSSKKKLLKEIDNIINKCTFSYTRQKQIKGLGSAIASGENLIGNEPFGVVLADDLCDNKNKLSVLAQMSKIHAKYPNYCIVAIEEISKKHTNKYGIIKGDLIESNLYKVNYMVEKPEPKDAPSNLAIIGRYILTPNIFDVLKTTKSGKNGEIQITDALNIIAKQGKVLAYKFDGVRFDCGSINGYVKAINYFYNK